MNCRRISLFAGHYGSGKSNVAVNYAIALVGEGRRVRLADLDIVNPYFRSKDCEDLLRAHGVTVISSPYANSNVDMPAIPAEAYAMTEDKSAFFVADVGGDDQGARALGRFADAIRAENDYEMFLVVNCFRPSTRLPEQVEQMRREIETAAHLPFTAIMNNSNLGVETTAETVLSSIPWAKRCSELCGLPLKGTSVWDKLYPELSGRVDRLLPMRLSNLQSW